MRPSIFYVSLLALVLTGSAFGADRRVVSPPHSKPGGNDSQGILIDETLYVSGQGGEDAAGKIPNDFDAEVRQCLENIGAVSKAGGVSPADVVSVQVYITDAAQVQRMNAVYPSYFKNPRPTRTTVAVARLLGPGCIEITVTARK